MRKDVRLFSMNTCSFKFEINSLGTSRQESRYPFIYLIRWRTFDRFCNNAKIRVLVNFLAKLVLSLKALAVIITSTGSKSILNSKVVSDYLDQQNCKCLCIKQYCTVTNMVVATYQYQQHKLPACHQHQSILVNNKPGF